MLSALLFCRTHSIQCMDQYKLICTVMVVCGILMFSKASSDAEEIKRRTSSTPSVTNDHVFVPVTHGIDEKETL